VVGPARVLPEKFTTSYESAVAFGRASEVQESEKHEAMLSLLKKYSPDFMEEGQKTIAKFIDKTTVIKIDINHITGKARK
jgi:nitroimidazol reductase NimA-like FMN-containing flavoprotein (pyridoxamine 5'-phosphate oxidase superfamily)